MFLAPNARDNLMTLLRLAREEADDLRADLADIELALAAASASLALPENEETTNTPADADETERRSMRRHRLYATREMLERAAEEAQQKLDASTAELKKLERLVAVGADASRSEVRLTSEAPRAGAFSLTTGAGRKLAS